jgi:hypothetical protein
LYDIIFAYLQDDRDSLVAFGSTNKYYYRQFRKRMTKLNHHLLTTLNPLYRTEILQHQETFIPSKHDNITVRALSQNFNLLTKFTRNNKLLESVYRLSARRDALVQLLKFSTEFFKPQNFNECIRLLPVHDIYNLSIQYLEYEENLYNIPDGILKFPFNEVSINLPLLFEISWVARAPQFARYHSFIVPLVAEISRNNDPDGDFIDFSDSIMDRRSEILIEIRYCMQTQKFFINHMTIDGQKQNTYHIKHKGYFYLHSFRHLK